MRVERAVEKIHLRLFEREARRFDDILLQSGKNIDTILEEQPLGKKLLKLSIEKGTVPSQTRRWNRLTLLNHLSKGRIFHFRNEDELIDFMESQNHPKTTQTKFKISIYLLQFIPLVEGAHRLYAIRKPSKKLLNKSSR